MNADLLFRWRGAVVSENGPARPVTRFVLLVLSLHMDSAGGSCFPSTKLIASETGLSERSVCTHIETASTAGWLKKGSGTAGKGSGKGWRRHVYQATFPDIVLKEIQQHGTERDSAATPLGAERGALGAERHDNLVLKDVQSSSSSSTSNNSTRTPAEEIYSFYLTTISPLRRSGKRAKQNITSHLKRHLSESLRQAILNYAFVALKSDPQYRKDPANFFGKNDPYFMDYLPGNFTQAQAQTPEPYRLNGVDLEAILAN